MTTDTMTRQAKPALSPDPKRAMQDMMETLDTLRNIYVAETTSLKAADTEGFFALQDQKIEAAQNYHNGISEFIARKDELLAINPDLKSLIRRKQEEFSDVARENLDALDRMRRTVERMGSRIMTAARETAAREGVAYSNSGSMNSYTNKPVTMGLNESA